MKGCIFGQYQASSWISWNTEILFTCLAQYLYTNYSAVYCNCMILLICCAGVTGRWDVYVSHALVYNTYNMYAISLLHVITLHHSFLCTAMQVYIIKLVIDHA